MLRKFCWLYDARKEQKTLHVDEQNLHKEMLICVKAEVNIYLEYSC